MFSEELESKEEVKGIYGDLTRPAEPIKLGSRHPISLVKNQITDIFSILRKPIMWLLYLFSFVAFFFLLRIQKGK